jgi:hypothetical protein
VADVSGAVDDEGIRQRPDAVAERLGKLDCAVTADERRVVESELRSELLDLRRSSIATS